MPKAISWFIHEAPWNQASANWVKTVFEPQNAQLCELLNLKVSRFVVNENPAQDVFLQNLMARFAPSHAGWPLNYFCEELSGRPLMVCGALDSNSLPKFLTQLRMAYDQNPEVLIDTAESNFKSVAVLPSGNESGLSENQMSADLVNATINSLVQSLDPKTGSFSRPWSFLFPQAYLALDTLDSEGPSVGLVALTQFLRSPQWDPIEGGFFRAVNFESGEFESEKLLLENLEMLEVLAHYFVGPGRRIEFVRDSFFEAYKFVLEKFVQWDGKKVKILEAVSENSQTLKLGNRDLLEALPSNLRPLASSFFGIKSEESLPYISKTIIEISKEMNSEPVDIRNGLLLAREKLSQSRNRKRNCSQPQVEACVRTQELFIYRILKIGKQMGSLPLPVELKGWIRERVREWMVGENCSLERALALKAYLKFGFFNGLLPSDAESKHIDFLLGGLEWSADKTEADRGWDVFDHLGASNLGLLYERSLLGLKTKLPNEKSLYVLKNIGIRGLGVMRHKLNLVKDSYKTAEV